MDVIRRFEFTLFEEAIATIKMYIHFYNNERLHSAIGHIIPKEISIKCVEVKKIKI